MADTAATRNNPSGSQPSLLSVHALQAWYGESQALHGLSFDVAAGEVVTLIGRNGAGKTTALRSIMGLLTKRQGSVRVDGTETIALRARDIARHGVAYCPEERGIFSALTVEENLLLPPKLRSGGMDVAEILQLFPNLSERLSSFGTKLSGGEQQMLAIARILRTGAKLLLLDEPTEGLAPVIVHAIGQTLRQLKRRGFTIVLVEQNIPFALSIADRHYVVEQGRVIDSMDQTEADAESRLHRHLTL